MESLLDTLKQRRDALVERGSRLAGVTRDRGVEALGRVRDGALDWHRTLEARRSELETHGAGPSRLVGLRLLVLDRFDHLLIAFGDRVRAEIQRLSGLELASAGTEPADAKKATAKKVTVEKASAKETDTKETDAKETDAKAATAEKATAEKATAEKATTESTDAKTTDAKKTGAKKTDAKKTEAKAATAETATSKKTGAKKTGAKKTGAKSGSAKAKRKAKSGSAKAKSDGQRNKRKPNGASRRLVMPIADYDELTAKEVLAELGGLSAAQCTTIYEHEKAHKKRKTVLRALEPKLD
ncbi:MAG TPA: histone H1-like repetitive region-containing protein [Sandaracinaceae bacterium LLY-WYZ-13_1]|nr:histone H1-like repetitive region-containing protein [Sandaracinaceae bacterium LLY-WYZ-13_1]